MPALDGVIAGTLTQFAEDLETQAPGLGLAAVLASGPALDAYLSCPPHRRSSDLFGERPGRGRLSGHAGEEVLSSAGVPAQGSREIGGRQGEQHPCLVERCGELSPAAHVGQDDDGSGGPTTKIHLACDGHGRPLSVLLSGGNVNNRTRSEQVLDGVEFRRPGAGRPATRPGRVLADKGYSSRANRAYLRRRGIRATIPERSDQQANRARRGSAGGRPPAFDKTAYKR